MTDPRLLARVERTCARLAAANQPVTFTAVADKAGLGRATLYRDTNLRALVNEHRARAADAGTLSGITTEIGHLRAALEEIAAKVRRHEEQLRRLERRTDAKNQ